MTATLDAWRDSQRELRAARAASPLAADVVDIRSAILRPAGTFELLAKNSFSSFRIPSTAGYAVVNPDIRVIGPDGITGQLTIYQDLPNLPNVVFWSTDEIALARRLGVTLAGTGARATTNAAVRDFWNSAFAIRNGHDGGWVMETYPRIISVRFLDEVRTRAAVAIATSYEGATVLMEKRNGVWQILKLVNVWIS